MIENYLWTLHIGLVALSLSLFLWRGLYMWKEQALTSHFWRRRLPDSIDTALLMSGIALAYTWGFSPWHHDWLLIKIIAICCYIIFGIMALRKSGSLYSKRVFLLLALITAAYIITVVHTKLICPPWLC